MRVGIGGRDTKEVILQVAQGLFARFGLLKTTVDEIARLAHIGKGTIYHYFRSKEDIFAAVIAREAHIFREKIQEAIQAEETPQGKLRAFALARARYLKELTNYYSTLTEDYLRHYELVEKERRKYQKEEIQIVKSILDEGVEKGIFEIEDTQVTAMAIAYALKGLEYPWIVETELSQIEQSIDLMLNILLKGIEKR